MYLLNIGLISDSVFDSFRYTVTFPMDESVTNDSHDYYMKLEVSRAALVQHIYSCLACNLKPGFYPSSGTISNKRFFFPERARSYEH